MVNDETSRRGVLQTRVAVPLAAWLTLPGDAGSQQPAGNPAKVDTKRLVARIKPESVMSGPLGGPPAHGHFSADLKAT